MLKYRTLLVAALVGSLVFALSWAIKGYGDARHKEGYAAKAAEVATAAAKEAEQRRAKEARAHELMKEKERAHNEAVAHLDAARAAAVSELDRLRVALRARREHASGGAGEPAAEDRPAPDGAGESDLLGSCAARSVELATEADRLAVKLTGLQQAVAVACPGSVEPER